MPELVKFNNSSIALKDTLDAAKSFIQNARAANTVKAYSHDIQDFVAWCDEHGFQASRTTPEMVALYISSLAEKGRRPSTIRRRLSAIRMFCESQGHDNPTGDELVKSTMQGIQRKLGIAPNQKKPILTEDIHKMIAALPDTLIGIRDKALLLLGFAGAFRRSELVALDVEDLEFNKGGLVATLRRSKTDQQGAGLKKAIPYGSTLFTCPVRALKDWLIEASIDKGAVFRSIAKGGSLKENRLSDKDVARVVKRTALKAGLKPDHFAGHSLRAGFATQAAISGARFDKIMDQGGWKSELTVRRYIRDGNLFRDNAAGKLGL